MQIFLVCSSGYVYSGKLLLLATRNDYNAAGLSEVNCSAKGSLKALLDGHILSAIVRMNNAVKYGQKTSNITH